MVSVPSARAIGSDTGSFPNGGHIFGQNVRLVPTQNREKFELLLIFCRYFWSRKPAAVEDRHDEHTSPLY